MRNINYTLQSELGKYGARWGCYATSILNCVEHEIGRKCNFTDILAIIGAWFMSQSIFLANYHNHKSPLDRGQNWDATNDPEWHFLVGDPELAYEDCFHALSKVPSSKKGNYEIRQYNLYTGSHYCACINGVVINPDPSLKIAGAEYKTVIKF